MYHPTSDIILSIPARSIAWPQYRAEFLAGLSAAGSAAATVKKYRRVLDLVEGLGIETTDQLTAGMVDRFVTAAPPAWSPHTLRSILMGLRAICYDAEGRRYVAISPFRMRKLCKLVRVRAPAGKRHQTAGEVRSILDWMRRDIEEKQGWPQWKCRRLFMLTATVAYCGLRAGEAQRLHLSDLDLDQAVINLVPRTRSGRLKTDASAAPVVMPKALVPILRDWLTHRLDHPDGFDMPPEVPWVCPGTKRLGPWCDGPPGHRPVDRLKAVARRAGVEGVVTFLSLRKSWATLAEVLGVPLGLISRQCRHTNEETTRRWYLQRDLPALHDHIDGFDF